MFVSFFFHVSLKSLDGHVSFITWLKKREEKFINVNIYSFHRMQHWADQSTFNVSVVDRETCLSDFHLTHLTFLYICIYSPWFSFPPLFVSLIKTVRDTTSQSSFVIFCYTCVVKVWFGEGGATCRCLLTAARLDNSDACATYIVLVTLLPPKWAFSQVYGRNGLAPHRGRVVWPREQPCHLPPRWLEWVLTMTEHQAPWHPGPRDKLIRDERWDTQVLALPELIGLPPERTSTR